MRITRNDIARKAGVSTATVSYVINGSNRVSEETRRRVQKIIDEYNYRPDLIARAMSMKSTMQIALWVNDLSNNFFSEIITEFEKAAVKAGYCVNICTCDNQADTYINSFVSRRVDGIFCMVNPTRVALQKLYALKEQANIPVVISGNSLADSSRVSVIEPDYAQGMQQILEYLKDYGHRRIVFLNAFPHNFGADVRLKYFIQSYDRLFLNDEKIILTGTFPFATTVETGYEMTEKLLQQERNFTAILTTNDSMAIGCIEALEKRGIRVPNDISVMGIDNIPIGKHVAIPLTTIGFDKYQFANDAFTMLYKAMTTGELSEKKEQMYITERKSVSLCPVQRAL